MSPPGSRFADRIYHVCGGMPLLGIQVRHSDDRGETCSDAAILGAHVRLTPFARVPAIAVNRDGVVAVAWYDGRGDPGTIKGSRRCQEMYVAVSLDGAMSFGDETRISTARGCPGARDGAYQLRTSTIRMQR